MYQILEDSKRMTEEEMWRTFKGKWIFVVDCDYELGVPMKTGIPKVVADVPWEGRKDGIYKKLKEEYGRTKHISYLLNEWNVFSPNEFIEYV